MGRLLILVLAGSALGLMVDCGDEVVEGTEREEGSLVSAIESPIPVILDTDIGSDIDDTWALALVLSLSQLDLRMVVTDSGDTETRARITAKFLERSGRSDVSVAVGKPSPGPAIPQARWADDYDLDSYPGAVHRDGISAMVDLIMASEENLTLICIGPVPNIREALKQQPAIAGRARVFAMSGSVDLGYGGKPEPDAEYNVQQDPAATRAMYSAKWNLIIAPLDTAGLIQLKGELYQRIYRSDRLPLRALLENYRVWTSARGGDLDPERESSILFDPAAVVLVTSPEFCVIEEVRLEVTDDGFTRRSPEGSPVRAALGWRDVGKIQEWLVDRLTQ